MLLHSPGLRKTRSYTQLCHLARTKPSENDKIQKRAPNSVKGLSRSGKKDEQGTMALRSFHRSRREALMQVIELPVVRQTPF